MGGAAGLKLLLDTHIWIWLLEKSAKIRPAVLRACSDERNEIWVSPISTWEALTLASKKRIQIPENWAAWLTLALSGARQAPLTHEIALASCQLPLHPDPADRLIAATAKVLDMTLVTSDDRLLRLPGLKTLPNR
jgi:PIN domain nuclease of toxin-antitoxin system